LALRQVAQSLDRMMREAGNDTVLERELAESYLSLGEAQELGYEASPGKVAEVRASYQKAVTLLSDAARSAPSDMRAQTDVARARNQLATAMGEDGYVNDAFDMLEKQAASLEQLGARKPLDATARFVLARTYFELAELHRVRRQPWLSLRARLHAIQMFQDLAEKDAKNREVLRWWSTSEKRLAALYLRNLNQPVKAVESLNTAVKLDRQRVAQNPGDPVAKMDLTLGQTYMAALMRRRGDLAGAQALFEAAISAGIAALNGDPNNYKARYLLATDYEQLGDLLRDEKRPADARARYLEGSAAAAALQPKAAGDADAQRVIASLRNKAAGGTH